MLVDIEDEWCNRPIVPLRPIWPSFAINTVFYAAILWMFMLGPFRSPKTNPLSGERFR